MIGSPRARAGTSIGSKSLRGVDDETNYGETRFRDTGIPTCLPRLPGLSGLHIAVLESCWFMGRSEMGCSAAKPCPLAGTYRYASMKFTRLTAKEVEAVSPVRVRQTIRWCDLAPLRVEGFSDGCHAMVGTNLADA